MAPKVLLVKTSKTVMSMTCKNTAAMKSTFKSILFAASVSFLAASCAKEVVTPVEPADEHLMQVTIIAGNPEVTPETKTEMVGSQPYWSVNDAIGVSNGTTTNYKFTTDIAASATSASFTGTTSVSSTLYAYYPYTNNGVGHIQDTSHDGAKVDLPNNQNPTATSFDGRADIMVAKQFTVDPENTTVEDLEFTRLGAIVKIVLIDKDGTMIGTQHPTTVSMTAESALAGRVLIDMQNQNLDAPYYNATSSVTANYTTETKYAIDGTNATYLIVYPQTLAEGSTLTIAASTEDYTLSKEITVPAGGIELQPGKVTTLKIKFAAANIISGAGAALPFTDDFSWQTASSNALSSVDAKYSAFGTAYADKGAGTVRIGTSSATGYLTTEELDLSADFHVIVSAYAYNAGDGSKIKVVIDGETAQTASEALTDTSTPSDYIFNFSAATKKSKVTITTDKKRAVLTGIQIISGTYVPAPKAITFTQPTGAAATAGCSFTVSVGGSPITSGDTVASGTTVTLTATAGTDYEFTSWAVTGATVADASAATTTFVMGTSAVTVGASFTSTGGGGNPTTTTYTFTSKAWNDATNSWTSGKDGNQMQSGRGVQVTTGATGANATTKSSLTGVTSVVVTYSTNASNGAGSIAVKIGNNDAHSQNVTKTGGTTDRTLTYTIDPAESGNVTLTVTCTTNSIYVKSVAITHN